MDAVSIPMAEMRLAMRSSRSLRLPGRYVFWG
jgi:hypothetical protein